MNITQDPLIRLSQKYMNILVPEIHTSSTPNRYTVKVTNYHSKYNIIFSLIQKKDANNLLVHKNIYEELELIFGDSSFIEEFIKVWFKETYKIDIDSVKNLLN